MLQDPGCRSIATKTCEKIPRLVTRKIPHETCKKVPDIECYNVIKEVPELECVPKPYEVRATNKISRNIHNVRSLSLVEEY